MYFATGSAKTLAISNNDEMQDNSIIGVWVNVRRSHFAVLTQSDVAVWRVRSPVLLASLRRTQISLDSHGYNLRAFWSPDGSRIVIQTTSSFIVLVNLYQTPEFPPFSRLALPTTSARAFLPGPGEGPPIEGLFLQLHGVISTDGKLTCLSPRMSYFLFSTLNPAAVQRMPWPENEDSTSPNWLGHETWLLDKESFSWLEAENDVTLFKLHFVRENGSEGWITSDGKAYLTQHIHSLVPKSEAPEEGETSPVDGSDDTWVGSCVYSPSSEGSASTSSHAMEIALNPRFSMLAVGLRDGTILYISYPTEDDSALPPKQVEIPDVSLRKSTGMVTALEWTNDGYALAIGWEHGWAVFSVGGRCLSWVLGAEHSHPGLRDKYMRGVSTLFWGPGNFELFLASSGNDGEPERVSILSFSKSSFTTQQTPDNTRYAFLMLDDRVLVYRGADQPDMSVINPESDVWQSIRTPVQYIADNWPLRYSTISGDGRLIAVAGRRGLIHYSMSSGRWKCFDSPTHEQAFFVRGGLLWFHHVLVAAVEMANRSYQIHLYSRDHDLAPQNLLHTESFETPIITLSLIDNSLLVYTTSNELHHFLILPTADSVVLHNCGSISFEGVVAFPSLVRGMSWMIPASQKSFGEAHDDMTTATIFLLIGGQLVLLIPRKNSTRDVRYDLKILADRIEFCWIHLRGVGALENSLWGYDGEAIRIWLDALTIETQTDSALSVHSVVENVKLPLDFYPLSVLMDKGIVIGTEQEIITRASLPVAIFRLITSSHLFISHILRYHIAKKQVKEAVQFALNYQNLVFFSHSLEILLHSVLESEDDVEDSESILHTVIEFLDHFDVSLEVVVGCARKTEMTRWTRLFDAVGNPKTLFESCMRDNRLNTAASYLLVLHNLQQLEETVEDAIRLLSKAIETKDIAKDLMRFLRSVDDDGTVLKNVLDSVGVDVSL